MGTAVVQAWHSPCFTKVQSKQRMNTSDWGIVVIGPKPNMYLNKWDFKPLPWIILYKSCAFTCSLLLWRTNFSLLRHCEGEMGNALQFKYIWQHLSCWGRKCVFLSIHHSSFSKLEAVVVAGVLVAASTRCPVVLFLLISSQCAAKVQSPLPGCPEELQF